MHDPCTTHAHEARGPLTIPQGLHGVPAGHLAAVVTYLEMRRAPAPRPVPEAPGVALGREAMGLGDYRDLFRRVGTPWLWSGMLERADAEVTARLADPDVETWVLRRGGEAIGLLELDRREVGACEIAYLGLVPAASGAGLGRRLMGHAIARAFADGPIRLHVHTCTLDAPGALEFYLRSGFAPVRQEVEVRLDPRGRTLPRDAAPRLPPPT